MKKRTMKRRISMLLIVAMVVTSFPSYVFGYANTDDTTQPVPAVEETSVDSIEAESGIKYDPDYDGEVQIEDELTSKRGEFEKHFVKSDGTAVAVSYPQKVHYQVDGVWTDIDSQLVLKDKEKGLYGPASSDLQVSIPGAATADILVPASGDEKASVIDISPSYLTKITDGDYSISWNILGNSKDYTSDFLTKAKTDTLSDSQIPEVALAVEAQPDISKLSSDEQMIALPNLFSTAMYKNVIKNVDVAVTVTPDKLKENLIINSPKGFTSVSYLMDAGNLVGKIAEDNSVIFTNDKDEVIFTIPTPLMLDSNTLPEESFDIGVALEKTTQGYILTLTPDSKWMNDPARVYPVILDPTVKTTQSAANIMETYIHSGDTAGEHYTSSYIRIGDTDIAICRGYVDFATRPSINTDLNDIIGGDFVGYLVSGTSTYHSMTIYQPTTSWSASTITWANRPSNSSAIASRNGVDTGTYIKYTFPVDASVKNWYSTGVQNGYMIKYTDETINDYNWFYSSDHPTISTSYYTYLAIEYAPDNTNPVISSFTTNPATTSSAYTTNDNPVLSWSITENHLTEVQYAIGSGSYTKISTSKTGTYTIPNGKITTSGTYSIKLRAKDASGNYSTVSTKSYYFDVNAPTKTTTPPNGEPQYKFTPSGSNIIVDVWVSDAHAGLKNYKVGSTGTLITITTNPCKISYTVPATDPIRTLYVYDKSSTSNCYSETFNPGDLYAPNTPEVIQTGNGVEVVDNGDKINGAGTYRNPDGTLCPSDKIYFKINGGGYTQCDPDNEEMYISAGRYRLDLDRNIDNTVVVKAEDTYGNVCAETTFTLPKEIGVYEETATDISYDQLAAPLSITRSYKSNTNTWAFSFESKVMAATSDRILALTLQNGEKEYFIYDDALDVYIGATSGAEMIIASGYYCVEIDGYFFKYRTSDGKIYAIYLNSAATTPISQYSYDTSGTHIAIGTHTININTTKTTVDVMKGTETLATVRYTFASGQLNSVTDAMGRITGYVYTSNRLTDVSLGDGSNTLPMKTITYGTTGQVNIITSCSGSSIEYTYSTPTDPFSPPNSTLVTETASTGTVNSYIINSSLTIVKDNETLVPNEEQHLAREQISEFSYVYYLYEDDLLITTATLDNYLGEVPEAYNTDPSFANNYSEVAHTTYDAFERPIEHVVYKKIDEQLTQSSLIEYSYLNNSKSLISNETTTTNGGIETNTYIYNGFGMLTSKTSQSNSGSSSSTYVFDQYGTEFKRFEEGKVTRNVYDFYGRIIKEISDEDYDLNYDTLELNSEGIASTPGDYTATDNIIQYFYEVGSWNLTTSTDKYGNVTNYTYDNSGNLQNQAVDLYNLNHNMNGGISNVSIGTQNLVDYTYDATNKLTNKTFANGQSINYSYMGEYINQIKHGDTVAFLLNYSEDGVLTSKEDLINNTTTQYSGGLVALYDSSNNLMYSYGSNAALDTGGSEYSLLTEKSGSETYITQMHDSYDVFGLQDGSTSLYKNINATDGRVNSTNVKLNGLNGATIINTDYSYSGDSVSQVSNVIGSTTKSFSYSYDSEDRISTMSCGSEDVDYSYDTKDQLIRVNDEVLNKTFTYSYDSRGNMTSKSTYAYTLDSNPGTPTSTDTYTYGDSDWPDKLTSYNGQPITYDVNGNPINYKGYLMSWTAGRMLNSMVGNGKNMSFTYDEQGIRTQKTVNEDVTKYTTIDGRITSQKDSVNTMYFHYGQKNEIFGVMINGNEYIYVRNLHGDIVSMVDTNGDIVVDYSYDSWGEVQSITGSLASTIGEINPMRYRGYYQDIETGQYYLQSRYYDPQTCRMLNADEPAMVALEASNEQFYNLFSYLSNNPIKGADPSGYGLFSDIFSVASIVLAFAGIVFPISRLASLIVGVVVGGGTAILAYYGYKLAHEKNLKLWRKMSISYSTYKYRETINKTLRTAGYIAGALSAIGGALGVFPKNLVCYGVKAMVDLGFGRSLSVATLSYDIIQAFKGSYSWI